MATEHTPGPWKIGSTLWLEDPVHHMHGGQRHVTIEALDCTVALVMDDEGDPECPANAALIAAAPSMRLALQAIADAKPGPDTDFSKFAAILVTIARVELASLERAETLEERSERRAEEGERETWDRSDWRTL